MFYPGQGLSRKTKGKETLLLLPRYLRKANCEKGCNFKFPHRQQQSAPTQRFLPPALLASGASKVYQKPRFQIELQSTQNTKKLFEKNHFGMFLSSEEHSISACTESPIPNGLRIIAQRKYLTAPHFFILSATGDQLDGVQISRYLFIL